MTKGYDKAFAYARRAGNTKLLEALNVGWSKHRAWIERD